MAQNDPVRVGVLYSETGVTSAIETSQLIGTLLAIEEINQTGGINGRELISIRYDPQSSPTTCREFAERLLAVDKVNVLFGCYMSSVRKAVIPVVERYNGMLFYATLYEGFEFSSNVIYTGAAPNQNSIQLADFMTSSFGSRVYLVGSDYIYPYESNRIMSDLVVQRPGGEIVGKRYVPLDVGADEFADIVADIKDKQPDFVFSTVVGNATSHFYRAFAKAGIDPASIPIASLTTCEVEVSQMGVDVAAGHFTSSPYFESIDNPTNQAFLKRLHDRFGPHTRATACMEAAYFQTHLFANAMRQSGSDSIDALMPYLLGAEFMAPQGKIRIEASNNHTCLYPRIGQVNSQGQFQIVRASRAAVVPDPYLVTHSLGDWTLDINSVER